MCFFLYFVSGNQDGVIGKIFADGGCPADDDASVAVRATLLPLALNSAVSLAVVYTAVSMMVWLF